MLHGSINGMTWFYCFNDNFSLFVCIFTAKLFYVLNFFTFLFQQPLYRYPYSVVVTFGGCRDDFMLVVCQTSMDQKAAGEGVQVTERLLFSMPKPKVRFQFFFYVYI